MPRKTRDPGLIRLLDAREQAAADFERVYARARRWWTRMEQARQRLARLSRRIAQHEERTDA